ncbi:hypothetical protein F511_41780 [Dorcoceras hygrometricum]|uniref:Uncharacterized protein n=1 Tax=Dorcoceras hygrometricum TaxID=472368 RepID=A0A2Z6ZZQ5_9LAMI|nr:hypothetical protein F511_41780 [Dorcoceras hygrometricum]
MGFRYGVVALIIFSLITRSSCRDLRPSEHGLAYQEQGSPPPAQDHQMLSFFGGTTPPVALPEARNITDPWSRRQRDIGRDHLKIGLLVASAVCGLAGVVLLIVSGIVFLFRSGQAHPPPK